MSRVKVEVNKVGLEDITFGIGTEVQTRRNKEVVITKLNAANLPFDETGTLIEVLNTNYPNIELVGTSIAAVDTVSSSIDNVNIAATDIDSVNVVATNIASVNTTAANIDDVKAAVTSATNAQLSSWEAEAERLTADSYATEAEDVPVNIVTSDGDGTFTYTPTSPAEYSALHYKNKAQSMVPAVTGGDNGKLLQVDSLGNPVWTGVNEGFKNQVVNGRFQIWNRGDSFDGFASGTFTADGWRQILQSAGRTLVANEGNGVCSVSKYVSSTYSIFQNVIRSSHIYSGQVMTVSAKIRRVSGGSAVSFGAIGVAGSSNAAALGSPTLNETLTFPITDNFETYKVTFTVPTYADDAYTLAVQFNMADSITGTSNDKIEIKDVALEFGEVVTEPENIPYEIMEYMCGEPVDTAEGYIPYVPNGSSWTTIWEGSATTNVTSISLTAGFYRITNHFYDSDSYAKYYGNYAFTYLTVPEGLVVGDGCVSTLGVLNTRNGYAGTDYYGNETFINEYNTTLNRIETIGNDFDTTSNFNIIIPIIIKIERLN